MPPRRSAVVAIVAVLSWLLFSVPALAATFVYVSNAEDGEIGMYTLQSDGSLQAGPRVKAEKLAGPGGVRVNKAGCLDRCAGGPVAVVYPEAVWYTYVDQHDIDEIVDSHLKNGKLVERLLLPANVGR